MKLCAMTLCALLLAAGGMRAHGQWQNGGSMAGQILDGDGAPVEHARLDIEEMGTGTTYEVHTNGQGRFLLPQVAPGDYRIKVEAAGFAPWTEGGVEIGAGAQVEVRPRLAPAGRAIAAAAQENRRRWKREKSVLARLKESSGVRLAPVAPQMKRAEIAEVRREGNPDSAWAAFEPGSPEGQRSGSGAAVDFHRTAESRDLGRPVGNLATRTPNEGLSGPPAGISPPTSQNRAALDSPLARSGQVAGHSGIRPIPLKPTTGLSGAPKEDSVAKVHARVRVRTAQGVVTAEIAEVPIEVTPPGDWAAFEPSSPKGQRSGLGAAVDFHRTAESQDMGHPAGNLATRTPRKPNEGLSGPPAVSIPTLRAAKDGAPDALADLHRTSESREVGYAATLTPRKPKDGLSGPPVDSSIPLKPKDGLNGAPEDLPAVGSYYEPPGWKPPVPEETATERRAKREKAKLKELAEAFVPPRTNVTDTATHSEGADQDVSRDADETVAGQETFQAFEPVADISAGAEDQRRERQAEAAELDELVAPERRSEDARLHGEVFAEDRDKAWGSQNAFTTLTTQQPDGSFVTTPYQPPDRRMQYGLEMGGGVARGRGKWFVSVDELTRNFPGMAVPSKPQKFFAPLSVGQLQTLAGRLGAAGTAISPGQAKTDYTQTMGQLTALLGPVARTERQTIAFPRFDWKLDERNRISVGYDMVRLNAKNGMRSTPTATWGIGSFGTRTLRLDAISARLNTFVTANVLNELEYTHAHDIESEMADSPTAFEEQFAKNPFGVPPQVGVASGSGGFKFGTPSTLNRRAYPDELRQEAADTLSWVHGRNQIDVGYALDYVRDHTSGLTYATGAYRYSTKEAFVADMLSPDHCDASKTGKGSLPCWSTYRQTTGPTDFTFDTADYAGFATDTLKLWPDLTLSVGARYDYEKLPEPNASLVNADIPQTASLPSEGNLSPRAGFAWELPWSRNRRGVTTVVRGGFGIFYGRIPNTSVLAALTQTGAPGAQRIYLFKPLDVGAPRFPFVFSPHPDIQVKPDATYFATGFVHPRAEQAQLSIEQSLGRHLNLTLSYWGSFGSHLPRIVDQNIDLKHVGQITYTVDDPGHLGPLPVTYTSKFYYQRLNPKYQQMAAMESNANARYQAVGVSLRGRLTHALAVTLGYRYAHAVDDNPYAPAYRGRWDVLDPANLALEHGTSNEDIRDRLRGGLVLHEPWHSNGWLSELVDGYTMAMTGSVRSGRPYTMRVSSTVPTMSCSYQEWLQAGSNCVQIPLKGVITGVPVAISGLGHGLDGAGGGNWLPQMGRNTFRYPGTYRASMRMGKRFSLGGRTSLLFQADVTNVLNHRNVTHVETMGYSLAGVRTSTETGKLTYLSGANGHAAFGDVTNTNSTRTYTDRQIELIMKLIF